MMINYERVRIDRVRTRITNSLVRLAVDCVRIAGAGDELSTLGRTAQNRVTSV